MVTPKGHFSTMGTCLAGLVLCDDRRCHPGQTIKCYLVWSGLLSVQAISVHVTHTLLVPSLFDSVGVAQFAESISYRFADLAGAIVAQELKWLTTCHECFRD